MFWPLPYTSSYFEPSFWPLYPPLVKGQGLLKRLWFICCTSSKCISAESVFQNTRIKKQCRKSTGSLRKVEAVCKGGGGLTVEGGDISNSDCWLGGFCINTMCLAVRSGGYLVSGHHSHWAGERRAASLGAPPHEGFIPHPKEQPAHAGGQLQQTAQGVHRGLPQQRAQFCMCFFFLLFGD